MAQGVEPDQCFYSKEGFNDGFIFNANLFRSDLATELAECGWPIEVVTQSDGTTTKVQVPLTALEFLHPQDGYRLPNSTFHDNVAGDAKNMLTRRYANSPDVGVFRDLLIE